MGAHHFGMMSCHWNFSLPVNPSRRLDELLLLHVKCSSSDKAKLPIVYAAFWLPNRFRKLPLLVCVWYHIWLKKFISLKLELGNIFFQKEKKKLNEVLWLWLLFVCEGRWITYCGSLTFYCTMQRKFYLNIYFLVCQCLGGSRLLQLFTNMATSRNIILIFPS